MVILLLFALSFTGCSNDQGIHNGQKTQQVDDKTLIGDQEVAAKAEKEIRKLEEVTDVVAVSDNNKTLLLGFKIKQFSKFRTKKIEKKVKDKLNKSFPDYEITSSSDLKIFIETSKIKNKLAEQSSKERKKEIEKIIKLSNEQT
jgi:hypothetical protein